MEFQIISWDARDENNKCIIHMFGRTEDGRSVHAWTPYKPFFFVKDPNGSVRKKELWGFQNGLESRFTVKEFTTLELFRKGRYSYKNVYESNIDPIIRFMHRTGIRSTGWVRVPQFKKTDTSTCTLDLYIDDWRTITPIDPKKSSFRTMSIDIECYSESGKFPDPMNLEDTCFQIACTTKQHGEYISKICFGIGTGCSDEKDLLEKFTNHMIDIDPDIVTGWNVFGFDFEYIFKRMQRFGVLKPLGRMPDWEPELFVKNLSSSALGVNILKILKMPGRFVFDMYQEVKREHKFESYSLDNVSRVVLNGDSKLDMPVHEIFSRFRDRNGLELVAEYCIKDTELPHGIYEKLMTLRNLLEMANVCWVPVNFLSERGQQIKVFSQLAHTARELGFIIPVIPKGDPSEYQGATVLEAQTGAYSNPITALDFESLYPSIMCAHNLCYSTYVMDQRFMNLPGVEYEQFGNHVFAMSKDGVRIPSLLPVILERLKVHRKEAKKMMVQDPENYEIYNARQLAYKISMNSVYGFTGASNGMLPLVAIAETVTFVGRRMIEISKNHVETNFKGAKVRYGDTDSIMVEFDVSGSERPILESWILGELAAAQISSLFKAPNRIVLEKVYCPYVLYSKKRYAAKMWEVHEGMEVFKKIDVKGLQTVRRDFCPFVREVCENILNSILEKCDPTEAIRIARDSKERLLKGQVPMSELTLTKKLGNSYTTKVPHQEVCNKIRKRNPGSEPQVGSRVPFVIIKNGSEKMFQKAEDPAWVLQNPKIKLDYGYYFEHQLRKSCTELIEPLVGDSFDPFADQRKQRKLTEFFS
jgi:DNA polymerase delta subunit 1